MTTLSEPAQNQPAQTQVAHPAPQPAPVPAARLRRRHWRLVVSFVLLVLLPVLACAVYLWAVAADRYASTTGFTVRGEETTAATTLLGGLSTLTGGVTSQDGDILYEFILSPEIVANINQRLDLVGHYGAYWQQDPVFALHPKADQADLLTYWRRVVQVSYDQTSGLIEVQVLAYDPQMARDIAREIVEQGQAMINALSTQAREDALRYARDDLAVALARLKQAREELTRFRTRTQLVDPEADLQGRMGVMNTLQQQLAEALIDHDLLLQTASDTDLRVVQAARRISAIQDLIRSERNRFAGEGAGEGSGEGPASTDAAPTVDRSAAVDADYPQLLAEFEGLMVDREYAEESYGAALAALELARANAARQSRYLATYVQPTLADSAQYPRRLTLSALALLFLTLMWSVLALIYYSIRDRA
ncbi:sugar transporter [Thalassobius sp. Cn5-15]|uniref:sugar transporter n=1 Tax=Thalassobius sp. Cn5-15 TaxID=2917763 RepID=UPI001EF2D1C8|nr:sugar transporter [Thalassobius sp. Cn5-15]MCG7495026.1 sugar transporter [Thalassobius sp. Cn5-15]